MDDSDTPDFESTTATSVDLKNEQSMILDKHSI